MSILNRLSLPCTSPGTSGRMVLLGALGTSQPVLLVTSKTILIEKYTCPHKVRSRNTGTTGWAYCYLLAL
jgi:hypothetical protein